MVNEFPDSCLKLFVNAQSQSLEVAWMEGYASGQGDYKYTANPYQEGTQASQYWNEGWDAGFYGETPLFPQYAVSVEAPENEQTCEQQLEDGSTGNMRKWLYSASLACASLAVFTTSIIDFAA